MIRVECKTTGEVFTLYNDYLKSQHWDIVKTMFRDSSSCRHKCYVCGVGVGNTAMMNIHHRTYANIGNEHEHDLVELCRDCHVAVHAAAQGFRASAPGRRPSFPS